MNNETIEIARRIRLSPTDLWKMLTCHRQDLNWFSRTADLQLDVGARIQFQDGAALWRSGRIENVVDHQQIDVATVAPITGRPEKISLILAGASTQQTTEITIAVTCTPEVADDTRSYWTQSLLNLDRLAARLHERRSSPRQAVIVIHGIGEQEPGRTINDLLSSGALVEGLREEEGDAWTKPDSGSKIHDLRKWSFQDSTRPKTEVIEFYWAHLVNDTTMDQIIGWLTRLTMRPLGSVPKRLLVVWLAFWLTLLVAVVGAILQIAGEIDLLGSRWGVLVAIGGLLWSVLVRQKILAFVGDAARYLTPKPANIEQRQAIRTAGVELLARLHDSRQYDRIIVLGHSLGSVIAYDIVSAYWTMAGVPEFEMSDMPSSTVQDLERLIFASLSDSELWDSELNLPALRKQQRESYGIEVHDKWDIEGLFLEDVQRCQFDAWVEARKRTVPWLITDLVTVGSPLNYADFLLARSKADFDELTRRRLLPRCPPVHEVDKTRKLRISHPELDLNRHEYRQLHHGACFALIRWSNLYYHPLKDLVAGPLQPNFGHWVRDVPLKRKGIQLHTKYWDKNADTTQLRNALAVGTRAQLREVLRTVHPAQLLGPFEER